MASAVSAAGRSPSLVEGGAPGAQSAAAIIPDGDGFLAVWIDANPSVMRPTGTPPPSSRVRARRIEHAGSLQPGQGEVVATLPTTHVPAVAACFGRLLLVWSEGATVRGMLVPRPGPKGRERSRPAPLKLAITGEQPVASTPAVACAGPSALVAWSSGTPAESIHVARVAPGRQALTSDTTVLIRGDPAFRRFFPRVATDGAGYLITWHESTAKGPALLAARIGADGRRLDEPFVTVTRDTPHPSSGTAAAVRPGAYVVAWVNGDGSGTVKAALLEWPNVSTAVELAAAPAVSPEVAAGGAGATAGAGAGVLVLWSQWSSADAPWVSDTVARIRGAWFDPAASRAGPAFDISPAVGYHDRPTAACAGGGCAVAWSDAGRNPAHRQGSSEAGLQAWAATVRRAAAEPQSPVLLSSGFGQQRAPRLARGGKQVLLAWIEDHGEPPEIRASRVRDDGTLADDPGLVLSSGDRSPARLRVVSDGRDFLVAWTTPDGRRARRVSAEGKLLDAEPLPLPGTAGPYFDIAFDGADYVVAWMDGALSLSRIGRDGVIRPGVATVSLSGTTTGPPALSCSGGECLVVSVGGEGFVLRDGALELRSVQLITRLAWAPVLGGDGRRRYVAWQAGSTIRGRAIDANGAPGPLHRLSAGWFHPPPFAVRPFGGGWAVALQRTEYPESPLALVTVNGNQVRTEIFATGSEPDIETDGLGGLFAAWTEIERGTDARRVHIRQLRRPGR